MKGIAFGREIQLYWFQNFCFAAKGCLAKREEDPAAVVCLGDSAFHRSSVKGELGLGLPVLQRNDGVQQMVKSFVSCDQ